MNLKNIITVSLLIFIIASIVYLVVGESSTSTSGTGNQTDGTIAAECEMNGIIVYYLHFTKRCATCNKIEELSHKAIREKFAEELGNGSLFWKTVNVEEPGYTHFEEEYQLISQSLILVDAREGRNRKWKNLDQIWELVWQENQFLDYVEREINKFLKES